MSKVLVVIPQDPKETAAVAFSVHIEMGTISEVSSSLNDNKSETLRDVCVGERGAVKIVGWIVGFSLIDENYSFLLTRTMTEVNNNFMQYMQYIQNPSITIIIHYHSIQSTTRTIRPNYEVHYYRCRLK